METAALPEQHARFKTFELNLRAPKLPGNGLKLKLQGRPMIELRVRQAQGFDFAPLEGLTPGILPPQNYA
jgi:hypothetical protein